MTKTPQNLKGFRDFLPPQKRKRDWVQSKITESFQQFGFEPLETPTLEYSSLLLGKYGAEADKLVYTFDDKGGRSVGLRYDQTVPTARVLGQYQNQLPKFFRRYQIQNVFRADKPQKGRYREFTQCDIDIFGSTSSLADAEILACTYAAYKNIGFEKVVINVNDRELLIKVIMDIATDLNPFSVIQTLDKQDKIPEEKLRSELSEKGLSKKQVDQIYYLKDTLSPTFKLEQIINLSYQLGISNSAIEFQWNLARGLDYYTGMIFEVIIDGYSVGSVGGGGRYDNLIADLTGQSIPAVGMAFGFDRTVEAADQLGLIPPSKSTAQALVTIFDDQFISNSLQTASALRKAGINTELYPAPDKLSKQFKLANQKAIPFVLVIGQSEIDQNQVTLKNMNSGDQQTLPLPEAIETIKAA